MEVKPATSRSLVLEKDRVLNSNKARWKVKQQPIPAVSEQPVKILGKWFRGALNNKASKAGCRVDGESGEEWITRQYKTWCYQHAVLPRLLWPMLVYKIPLTRMEALEQKISQYFRRWPSSQELSGIGLYSTGSMVANFNFSQGTDRKNTKSQKQEQLWCCGTVVMKRSVDQV